MLIPSYQQFRRLHIHATTLKRWRMPYFLVSHSVLVEADDEETAAAKVYGDICDKENITFSVTADEQVTTRITIPTRTRTELYDASSVPPSRQEGALVTSTTHDWDAPVVTSDQSASVPAGFCRRARSFLDRFKPE